MIWGSIVGEAAAFALRDGLPLGPAFGNGVYGRIGLRVPCSNMHAHTVPTRKQCGPPSIATDGAGLQLKGRCPLDILATRSQQEAQTRRNASHPMPLLFLSNI